MNGYRFDVAEVRERAGNRLLSAPQPPARGDDDLNPSLRVVQMTSPVRDAAVLVPIVKRAPEVSLLLTQRHEQLKSHSGQVALPGGKLEAADNGPTAAALREAFEEIGLPPASVEPLGFLDTYLTRTGYRIVPVVGFVPPDFVPAPHSDEVSAVFEVPLRFLMTPGNHQRHSRVWQGETRYFHAMPWENRYIWGATAGMLMNLYDRLYRAAG